MVALGGVQSREKVGLYHMYKQPWYMRGFNVMIMYFCQDDCRRQSSTIGDGVVQMCHVRLHVHVLHHGVGVVRCGGLRLIGMSLAPHVVAAIAFGSDSLRVKMAKMTHRVYASLVRESTPPDSGVG